MSSATEFDLNVHRRILAGDAAAFGLLCETYLAQVHQRLQRRFRDIQDEAIIHDAVVDAFFKYQEHPERYQPERMALLDYLVMSADGDLRNERARAWRRAARQQPLDPVAHLDLGGNSVQETEARIVERLSAEQDAKRYDLHRLVQETFPDPRDRRMLSQILDDVRETEPYARILEIEHLEKKAQEKIVKQHKDRLKKRLERLKGKLRDEAAD
jgi:hypothetical protein